mgnify:FL=1
MSKDPYQILGVSTSASEEEIKAAYRELAKKYHPDNYADNPLADLAQEKMQEINEAYDTLIRERRQGRSGSAAYGASGSSSGQAYSAGGGYRTGGGRYADIRGMIRAGRILDAETLLDGIPASGRDAEWHFLKGSVLYRKGWLEDAYAHFQRASQLAPQNAEYRSAVMQMEQRRTGGYRTGGSEMDACDCCSSLLCLNCLCHGCR